MSIINDALKKTQQNVANHQNSSNISELYANLHSKKPVEERPNPASPAKAVQKISEKSSPKKILMLVFFVIGIAVFLSSLILIFSSKKPPKPIEVVKSLLTQGTSKLKAPEPKRTYEKGELFLNGTMEMQGKTVALINDEIYEVGDIVNGQEITAIRLDGVELLKGGQKTFLSVR